LTSVYLIGNVTRDPEVRYTPVAELGLAINRVTKAMMVRSGKRSVSQM
jgi:single-stranded DNA-binding protein